MGAGLRGHSRGIASLLAAVGLIAVAWLLGPGSAHAATDRCKAQNEDVVDAADVPIAERSLLCLVNVHRAAHGAPVLVSDPALASSARAHSEDMVATGTYSTYGSDGSTPEDRAHRNGYAGAVAETVYALPRSGGVSPIQFFLGWKDAEPQGGAPSNYEVLLDRRYVAAGTGFALGAPLASPGEPAIPGATATQDLGTTPAAGSYTALDMLVPAECRRARKAVRKAKRRLAKAKAAGRRVAAAKRKLKRRKAAARRACNPSRF